MLLMNQVSNLIIQKFDTKLQGNIDGIMFILRIISVHVHYIKANVLVG